MTEFINQLSITNTKPFDLEKWRRIINEWEASNETQKNYCKRLGLNIHTFSYARSKLSHFKKSKPTFIPVTLNASSILNSPKIEIITIENLQGLKLHIPSDLSLDCLSKIFRLCGWSNAEVTR